MSNIAVITGAGRGLGRAIAERLAKRSYRVLVSDIDGDAAAKTAAELGNGAWSERQDVRDPDSHRAIAKAATQRGDVKVWINNAGVLTVGPTWEMADADVRRMVEINVLGVMYGCHAAVPVMADDGHIINIASISGLTPTPGLAVYGATKHAVVGYSLSLAGELRQAGRRIHVSALAPDAIQGDMTNAVAHDDASALLFSAGKLLTLDAVADAAVELLDHPKHVKVLPAYRAAAIHALRPFPRLGLPLLDAMAKIGRWRTKR
ncbi:MAG TPA: SDR family NAD(P)-dependent oxidoreductase [Kofleriaceae bacterium]|nr:SDR family NAD(P)-dependent oxidoreductase [Kofleriaceae bacterium]